MTHKALLFSVIMTEFDFSGVLSALNSGVQDGELYWSVLYVWIVCWPLGFGLGVIFTLVCRMFSDAVN